MFVINEPGTSNLELRTWNFEPQTLTTMNDCQHYEALIAERLFGDLAPEEAERLGRHLEVCPDCRALLHDMEVTLQITAARVRPEPSAAFWQGYDDRLAARIRQEEQRRAPLGHVATWWRETGRLNLSALLVGPRWTYQLSGAVALLILGVLIGWLLFGNTATEAPRVAEEESQEPVRMVSVEERADRYLERSRVLLMGLVNLEPGQDLSSFNLTRQREVARELIEESNALRADLNEADQERLLRALIEDLEVILLQIANLEQEHDLPSIEMVRRGVDRRAIMLKINVAEMRRADTDL